MDKQTSVQLVWIASLKILYPLSWSLNLTAPPPTSAFKTNGTTSTSGALPAGCQLGCSTSRPIAVPSRQWASTPVGHSRVMSLTSVNSLNILKSWWKVSSAISILTLVKLLQEWHSEIPSSLESCSIDISWESILPSLRVQNKRLPFIMEKLEDQLHITWAFLEPSTSRPWQQLLYHLLFISELY